VGKIQAILKATIRQDLRKFKQFSRLQSEKVCETYFILLTQGNYVTKEPKIIYGFNVCMDKAYAN
jgi:hypothetical protein